MFRRLSLILPAVVASFVMMGCNSVTGPKVPPPDPPAPPIQGSYMEARLNDRLWRAALPARTPGADTLTVYAEYNPSIQLLLVTGLRWPNLPDTSDWSLIGLAAVTPLEPGSIVLGGTVSTGDELRHGAAAYSEPGPDQSWSTDGSRVGTLVIERVDLAARRLEGRFEFKALNQENGSIIDVRGGVFRCRLIGMPESDPGLSAARRARVESGGGLIESLAARAVALARVSQLR